MTADWAHEEREAVFSASGTEAVYLISFVAEETGLHPQTLRQYDRLGLVSPSRARGRGRRYTERDVHNLRRVQQLTAEGVNLAGVKRILELEGELDEMRAILAAFTSPGTESPTRWPPEDLPDNLPAVRLAYTTALVRWIGRR